MIHLTEEHLAVREAARQFAQNELKPGVIQRDTKMEYPREQVRQMAELGFMGMMTSPDYGGGGMDTLSYVIAMEEISKVDSSCSVIMSVNNSLLFREDEPIVNRNSNAWSASESARTVRRSGRSGRSPSVVFPKYLRKSG